MDTIVNFETAVLTEEEAREERRAAIASVRERIKNLVRITRVINAKLRSPHNDLREDVGGLFAKKAVARANTTASLQKLHELRGTGDRSHEYKHEWKQGLTYLLYQRRLDNLLQAFPAEEVDNGV